MMDKVSSDVVFGFGIQLATRLRGLLFIPVITMGLGVAAFGAYSQIVALSSFLELIFGLGLYDALVRFGKDANQDASDIFYSHLIIVSLVGASISLLIFLNASLISTITLNTNYYTKAFKIGSILIFTRVIFRLQINYFRVKSKIKMFTLLQGVKAYALLCGVLVAIYAYSTGVAGIIYAMAVVELGIIFFLQLFIVRTYGFYIPKFKNIKQHLQYSLPIVGSNLSGNISSRADRMLLGYFIGPGAVGVYSVAYQISISLSMYIVPIKQAFFPKFSELIEKGNLQQCSHHLKKSIRYFLLVTIPSVAGLYLVGPDIVEKLVGGSSRVPSGLLLWLISCGILLQGLDQIYAVVLRANKQTAQLSVIRGSAALANILLNIILIPIYGVLGAAFSTLLTYLLSMLMVYLKSSSLLSTEFSFRSFLRAVISSVAMIYSLTFLHTRSIPAIILCGVMIYSTMIVVLGEFSLQKIRLTLVDR